MYVYSFDTLILYLEIKDYLLEYQPRISRPRSELEVITRRRGGPWSQVGRRAHDKENTSSSSNCCLLTTGNNVYIPPLSLYKCLQTTRFVILSLRQDHV